MTRLVTYSGLYGRLLQGTLRPTRRDLLDELFREDGQSLGALEARFQISRFGIAKHLKLVMPEATARSMDGMSSKQ